jgi:hypothetical protein
MHMQPISGPGSQWQDTENLDMVKRGLMDLTPWFDGQLESRDLDS